MTASPNWRMERRIPWTPGVEITHPADMEVKIVADGAGMSWASQIAVVLLCWLGFALLTGTIIGHGIAFGTGSDSE